MKMNKKKIAVGLLIIGVIGFIYSQNIKSGYRIYKERISGSKEFNHEFYLTAGNNYMFSVWGTDEEGALRPSANLEVGVQLLERKGKIVEEKLITATSSNDDGGLKRANNGYDIRYHPLENGEVILKSSLLRGDYVDIEVYENLPENIYWFPVLFIAVFIIGLILFLKARNSENSVGEVAPISEKIKTK